MQKTLTCTCGGLLSYNTVTDTDARKVDEVFYRDHTGEGHEVTEQPIYICDEEEW